MSRICDTTTTGWEENTDEKYIDQCDGTEFMSSDLTFETENICKY